MKFTPKKSGRLWAWPREVIWAYRVKKCWRQASGDYGQFLGNIGCYIAYGKLPSDILDQDQET